MKSKREVILENLKGQRVLDIGGMGYGEDNAYERELREAWRCAASRTTLDHTEGADIRVDLNQLPLPALRGGPWDLATAFDVLEHLDHPVEVLRWIPTDRLLVNLPNSLSPFCRQIEEKGSEHLFSFTAYTAGVLMRRGGWTVERHYYTMGKWSPLARLVNAVGSLAPRFTGTGLMLHCRRL